MVLAPRLGLNSCGSGPDGCDGGTLLAVCAQNSGPAGMNTDSCASQTYVFWFWQQWAMVPETGLFLMIEL